MTRTEQRMIRGYYPHWELRFRADGSVEARKRPGGAWGLLYTADDAERHLKAVRAQEATRQVGAC